MATKVDRTAPGSENSFRLTYNSGSKKWTNDRPGDGRGDPGEAEDIMDDLSVKRGLKRLEKAVMGYAAERKDGKGGNRQPIVKAAKEMETHIGSEKSKQAVRIVMKAERGVEGREHVVDGLEVAMGYLNGGKEASCWALRSRRYGRARGASQAGNELSGQAPLAWSCRRCKTAGLEDVAKKILKRFDMGTAKGLVERIRKYMKTKNDRDDISLKDSRNIYRPYDYGDVLPLSKKRDLDVDWTDHAEYRSDLRDVKPDVVNKMVRDWLKERLQKKGPDSKTVRMKLPGTGTAVVDYDLRQKPADADIVTVWASMADRVAAFISDDV